MTFKVGDRVECTFKWSDSSRQGIQTLGQRARVVREQNDRSLWVKWDDSKLQIYFEANHGPQAGQWGYSEWKLAPPSITDWSRVATRAGYPVEQVIGAADHASAIVTVAGRKLALSYSADGEFYPGHECPVDLVQI